MNELCLVEHNQDNYMYHVANGSITVDPLRSAMVSAIHQFRHTDSHFTYLPGSWCVA